MSTRLCCLVEYGKLYLYLTPSCSGSPVGLLQRRSFGDLLVQEHLQPGCPSCQQTNVVTTLSITLLLSKLSIVFSLILMTFCLKLNVIYVVMLRSSWRLCFVSTIMHPLNDFHKIRWKGGTWAMEETARFWW